MRCDADVPGLNLTPVKAQFMVLEQLRSFLHNGQPRRIYTADLTTLDRFLFDIFIIMRLFMYPRLPHPSEHKLLYYSCFEEINLQERQLKRL